MKSQLLPKINIFINLFVNILRYNNMNLTFIVFIQLLVGYFLFVCFRLKKNEFLFRIISYTFLMTMNYGKSIYLNYFTILHFHYFLQNFDVCKYPVNRIIVFLQYHDIRIKHFHVNNQYLVSKKAKNRRSYKIDNHK